MPVRSSTSSVLKWPDREAVERALHDWALVAARQRPNLERVGYLGSYARDDWGVGSDLDVVLVLRDTAAPFMSRAQEWDLTGLPVPADVLIYTSAEWAELVAGTGRFSRVAREETAWVYP